MTEALRSLLPGQDDRRTRLVQFAAWCPFPARRVGERVDGLWDMVLSVAAGERGTDYRKVGGSSGGSKGTGIVVNVRAVRVAERVEGSLLELVKACRSAGVAHTAPRRASVSRGPRSRSLMVPDMASWLLWRVDGMAWHPEVAPLVHEVIRAVDAAVWLVDRPPTRQQLGECPVCGGRLSATPGAAFARCENRECRHETEAQPLRDAVLTRLGSSLVSAAGFADLAVHLTDYSDWEKARELIRKRVNQWASRKRVLAVGHDDGGVSLYRFNELYALEAEHLDRARALSRREGA